MSDVLRILDRFRITGRGIVYTVKRSKGAVIHMGDIFSDLKGNRFVKSRKYEWYDACYIKNISDISWFWSCFYDKSVRKQAKQPVSGFFIPKPVDFYG